MSMETDAWMRIKTGETEMSYRHEYQPLTGRDIIFRTLMPGVFIYLIVYYAFAHDPFVADFYTKSFRQPQHHHEQLPGGNPTQEQSSPSTERSDPAFIA